jgi:hypothetical protein
MIFERETLQPSGSKQAAKRPMVPQEHAAAAGIPKPNLGVSPSEQSNLFHLFLYRRVSVLQRIFNGYIDRDTFTDSRG